MINSPTAAAGATHAPNRRVHSKRWQSRRLMRTAWDVGMQLIKLSNLERPGQWILHHEDLYRPGIDTRPHSRNPDQEILLDLPGLGKDTIWAGEGPAPDFDDIAFWEEKRKYLGEKIKEIEDGRVQPRFTPEDLKTLESLEQLRGHTFHRVVEDKRRELHRAKGTLFNMLFHLAARGRPGQWVLHNADVYHPAIDTRPATRAADNSNDLTNVLIRDATYDGDIKLVGGVVPAAFELVWEGRQPPPNFADPAFWKTTYRAVADKLFDVKEGRVQHNFTPAEIQTLEQLESDPNHAFAVFAEEARINPPVIETPELREQRQALFVLQSRVVNEMESLWEHGLAGKWVLHDEDLYVPMYDTHFRERDAGDKDAESSHIVVDSFLDLRLDTRRQPAPPNLGTVAYWEQKLADLRERYKVVEAGKLATHQFTNGELMRIKLLEHAIDDKLEDLDKGALTDTGRQIDKIAAWLDQGTDTSAIVAPAAHGERQQVLEETKKSAATKRKRTADAEHEPPVLGHGTSPAKRSKGKGPTAPRMPADRGGRPADKPPLRRSPRIAAQPPKVYK